jgi:hypothetical protein
MAQSVVRRTRPDLGRFVSLPLIDNKSSYVISQISANVNVRLWDLGEYQDQDASLPAFIDPDWIKGHLAMTTVSIGQSRTKVWATIDLAKVRIIHIPGDLL